MHNISFKSIEVQQAMITALFNANIIDLKEFQEHNNYLEQCKRDMVAASAAEQKTLKYKWNQLFKGKK